MLIKKKKKKLGKLQKLRTASQEKTLAGSKQIYREKKKKKEKKKR